MSGYLETYEEYAEVYSDWVDLYPQQNIQYLKDNRWIEFTWKLNDHGLVTYEQAEWWLLTQSKSVTWRLRGKDHPYRYFKDGKEIEDIID